MLHHIFPHITGMFSKNVDQVMMPILAHVIVMFLKGVLLKGIVCKLQLYIMPILNQIGKRYIDILDFVNHILRGDGQIIAHLSSILDTEINQCWHRLCGTRKIRDKIVTLSGPSSEEVHLTELVVPGAIYACGKNFIL